VQTDTACIVAALFGCGLYLVLSRNLVRTLFGFLLLSNAVNLLLLATSGDPRGKEAPIVGAGNFPAVDPLPQALILTAIVISFAVTAFLVVLVYRLALDHGTTDSEKLFAARCDGEENTP